MIVVEHGVEHCPVAHEETHVLLFERAGTPQHRQRRRRAHRRACATRGGPMSEEKRDAGTEAWHRQLHHTGHDHLSEDTAQTPGMRRFEAISGERTARARSGWARATSAPNMVSADHHHGEAETGIYVVSATRCSCSSRTARSAASRPGRATNLRAAGRAHREENPSLDEEAVVVLARSTQEGIVVNLPQPAGRGARARRVDRHAGRRAVVGPEPAQSPNGRATAEAAHDVRDGCVIGAGATTRRQCPQPHALRARRGRVSIRWMAGWMPPRARRRALPRRLARCSISAVEGRVAFALAARGYRVEGLDIAPSMIEDARASAASRGGRPLPHRDAVVLPMASTRSMQPCSRQRHRALDARRQDRACSSCAACCVPAASRCSACARPTRSTACCAPAAQRDAAAQGAAPG